MIHPIKVCNWFTRPQQTKSYLKKKARVAFQEDHWTLYSKPQVFMEARHPHMHLYLKKPYDDRIVELIDNVMENTKTKDQKDFPRASTNDFQGLFDLCIAKRIEEAMIRGEVVQLNCPMRFLRLHQYHDIPLNNVDISIPIVSPPASPTPDPQDKQKRHRLQHDMVAEYNQNFTMKSSPRVSNLPKLSPPYH